MRFPLSGSIWAVAAAAVASAPARAGGAPQNPAVAVLSEASAPSLRVGRLSLVSGKVELRDPGDPHWAPAEVNDPIATGSSLRTDPEARAEIHIGGDTIDIAAETEITVATLTVPTTVIVLGQGRIELDIPRLGKGESVEIEISRGSVLPLRPGRYDVDTGGGEDAVRIAAFTGAARFAGESLDMPIAAGDKILLNAGAPAATIAALSGDDFADWCATREIDNHRLAAPYFISPEMTGYAALDRAGHWRATAEFGVVWVPSTTPAGWAPYRDGHWRWFAPWGWT